MWKANYYTKAILNLLENVLARTTSLGSRKIKHLRWKF